MVDRDFLYAEHLKTLRLNYAEHLKTLRLKFFL